MKALYTIVLATGITYWGVKIFKFGEAVGEFKAQCKEVKKSNEELRESLKKQRLSLVSIIFLNE